MVIFSSGKKIFMLKKTVILLQKYTANKQNHSCTCLMVLFAPYPISVDEVIFLTILFSIVLESMFLLKKVRGSSCDKSLFKQYGSSAHVLRGRRWPRPWHCMKSIKWKNHSFIQTVFAQIFRSPITRSLKIFQICVPGSGKPL